MVEAPALEARGEESVESGEGSPPLGSLRPGNVSIRSGPSKAALDAHRNWLATASLRHENRGEARDAKALEARRQGEAFENHANEATAVGTDAANAAANAATISADAAATTTSAVAGAEAAASADAMVGELAGASSPPLPMAMKWVVPALGTTPQPEGVRRRP